MTTVAELKLEIIRLLGEEQGSTYPEPIAGTNTTSEMLLDSIRAALLSLSTRYWKSQVLEVEDEASDVETPDDLVAIEGVWDNELHMFIPRMFIEVSAQTYEQNSWSEYPDGYITFSTELASGGLVYYSAHWALPTQDYDEIEAPNMCLTFLSLYATSFCLLQKANGQAELRQYATKVDSGTPIMLPAKDMSDYFMRRAEISLQLLPHKQKGGM